MDTSLGLCKPAFSLMAISASDIRSALSLPQPTSAPRRTHSSTTKKPDGISRELYSLIGPSAPSLAAHLAKPRLKLKPNLGGGATVKWCASPSTHSSPNVPTGNTDPSKTTPAQMPCNSPTGLNCQTPLAVRHSRHPCAFPLILHRVSLCKVQRTAKFVRLLPGRVCPSPRGSVLSVPPLPVSSVHRQRMVKGGDRLSIQDRT